MKCEMVSVEGRNYTRSVTIDLVEWWIQISFNIIEIVWAQFDKELNKRQPTSKRELWSSLENFSWRLLKEQQLALEIQAVLKNTSDHTNFPAHWGCANCKCITMYVYMGGSGLLQSTVLFFLDSNRPWALWCYGITLTKNILVKSFYCKMLVLTKAAGRTG